MIAEHDIVQDFLTDDDENGASACNVDVKVCEERETGIRFQKKMTNSSIKLETTFGE